MNKYETSRKNYLLDHEHFYKTGFVVCKLLASKHLNSQTDRVGEQLRFILCIDK